VKAKLKASEATSAPSFSITHVDGRLICMIPCDMAAAAVPQDSRA
jgi:hypothetical protein